MPGMDGHAYLRFPPEAVHVEPAAFQGLPDSARLVFLAVRRPGDA